MNATGQRVNAVVVVALRRGHAGRDGGEGLSGCHLCRSVFVFDVPEGHLPEMRDGL